MTIALVGVIAALLMPADTGRVPLRERVALELRGGAAAGEVTAARSGPQWIPGAAWRVGARFAAHEIVAFHVGYGASGFGCDEGFCGGSPVIFNSRGFDAGVELDLGGGWLRGGVIRHALHSQWLLNGETQTHATRSSIGYEFGGGIDIPLTARLVLVPGARYSLHRGTVPGGEHDAVGYVTGDIGLRWSLAARR